jgi:small GTP-binding protein
LLAVVVSPSSYLFRHFPFRFFLSGIAPHARHAGVGKSALSVRFVQGNFVDRYDPTIEANYRKQVDIDSDACLLDILDTAGQDEYSVLREQYKRMGEGFVLVYSIISPQTFASIIKFHAQALRYARTKPSFILAGNKSDLDDSRAVTAQEGKELADNLQCPFMETSAKNNKNVNELFLTLVRSMHAIRCNSKPKARDRRFWNCTLL